jgi:hypothetical protein
MADAGASLVKPVKAGALKKGSHVLIKGLPCKVVEVTISKVRKASATRWRAPCRRAFRPTPALSRGWGRIMCQTYVEGNLIRLLNARLAWDSSVRGRQVSVPRRPESTDTPRLPSPVSLFATLTRPLSWGVGAAPSRGRAQGARGCSPWLVRRPAHEASPLVPRSPRHLHWQQAHGYLPHLPQHGG